MLERGALILQHGATGPPGVLGTWLTEHGIPARVVDLRQGEDPPDPAGFDFVASLGSEFSVNDGEPWIAVERRTLDRAVSREVPVLGLCFGGQSLAASLGGGGEPGPPPPARRAARASRCPPRRSAGCTSTAMPPTSSPPDPGSSTTASDSRCRRARSGGPGGRRARRRSRTGRTWGCSST